MSKRFCRIKPDDQEKGWRIRVDRDEYDNTLFAQEEVLPERVTNPNANRIISSMGSHWLTNEDVKWLHGVFGELLEVFKKEDEEGEEDK